MAELGFGPSLSGFHHSFATGPPFSWFSALWAPPLSPHPTPTHAPSPATKHGGGEESLKGKEWWLDWAGDNSPPSCNSQPLPNPYQGLINVKMNGSHFTVLVGGLRRMICGKNLV